MRHTFLELEEKGMHFSAIRKSYILLSSLDASFDTLVLTMETLPEKDLTMVFISGRPLEEQEKSA